jgi:hypothetical protein
MKQIPAHHWNLYYKTERIGYILQSTEQIPVKMIQGECIIVF